MCGPPPVDNQDSCGGRFTEYASATCLLQSGCRLSASCAVCDPGTRTWTVVDRGPVCQALAQCRGDAGP